MPRFIERPNAGLMRGILEAEGTPPLAMLAQTIDGILQRGTDQLEERQKAGRQKEAKDTEAIRDLVTKLALEDRLGTMPEPGMALPEGAQSMMALSDALGAMGIKAPAGVGRFGIKPKTPKGAEDVLSAPAQAILEQLTGLPKGAAKGVRKGEIPAGAMGKGSPKKLPPNTVLSLNEGQSVARLLPDVEIAIKNNEDIFGPMSGRMKKANPYNTVAQTVDARMRTASQAFGRFMEGGVLRKEDEEKYRQMFPQLADTPDVAKNKLKIVRRQLLQEYKSKRESLGKSGYDVGGFEDLAVPASIFEEAAAPAAASGGAAKAPAWSPEKEARLAELLKKKAAKESD